MNRCNNAGQGKRKPWIMEGSQGSPTHSPHQDAAHMSRDIHWEAWLGFFHHNRNAARDSPPPLHTRIQLSRACERLCPDERKNKTKQTTTKNAEAMGREKKNEKTKHNKIMKKKNLRSRGTTTHRKPRAVPIWMVGMEMTAETARHSGSSNQARHRQTCSQRLPTLGPLELHYNQRMCIVHGQRTR